MNVLILSDSHGREDLVEKLIAHTRPDAVLFAGDGLRDLPYDDSSRLIYAVRGNCDLYVPPVLFANGEAEEEALFYLEDKKILLMHGHRWGVKSGYDAAVGYAIRKDADILIFGHTHRPWEQCLRPEDSDDLHGSAPQKSLWVFNPGSLGHYPYDFGTLTIRGGQILFGHGSVRT